MCTNTHCTLSGDHIDLCCNSKCKLDDVSTLVMTADTYVFGNKNTKLFRKNTRAIFFFTSRSNGKLNHVRLEQN
jgi:hypothetical protein